MSHGHAAFGEAPYSALPAQGGLSSIAALPLGGAIAIVVAIAASSTAALPLAGSIDLDDPIVWEEGTPERLPLGGSVTMVAPVALGSSAAMPFGGSATILSGAQSAVVSGSGGRARAWRLSVLSLRAELPRPTLWHAVFTVQNPAVLAGRLAVGYTLELRDGRLIVAPLAAVHVPTLVMRGSVSLPPLSLRGHFTAHEPTLLDRFVALGLEDVFLD